MNQAVLDQGARAVFVPVRHHSPACARAVRQLALALRPSAILIEGPSDFNQRLDELYLPHELPIAIYSYVRLPDDTRRGAFYPFCVHSPEWQALQVAREIGAHAQFIDLPWAALARASALAHRYADGELRESPYVPQLCQQLGVEDFDSLWDTLFEIDPALGPAQLIERLHAFCYHLRATSPQVAAEDRQRETFMAEQIQRALDSCAGQVLVITGGFHSYALFARLHGQPPPEGAPPPDAAPEELPDATPIIEQGIALTPYADARLDSLTGYESGMPSPGFYAQVWHDRAAGQPDTYRRLLADTITDLRARQQIASTADLLVVESTAGALAALRGHAEVWRQDLIDAIIGALIKEAIDPSTRHPFLDALLAVFRGSARGALAEGVRLPPLVYDIREQLEAHKLTPASKERQLRLDLHAPADLAGSRVLHRLRSLGIQGFVRLQGTDLLERADLTSIWELWQISWSPEFDAACIEAAIYGATLADAAAALLDERAAAIDRGAERAAALLLDACLMGLRASADTLFARLIELVREDGDFLGVAAALGHVLYIYRYDTALGVAGRGDIGAVLVELFRRALWLLDLLGHPQGQDRALLRAVATLVQTYEVCAGMLALDRAALVEVLQRTGASAQQRALLRGAATGALWTLRAADQAQVHADLQSCASAVQLGDFLTGLFALARETVQRHPELLQSIDALLLDYDGEAFLQALPALRLAFAYFTPREKHYMVRTLLEAHGQADQALSALAVDVATVARALALESWLFDVLARYGLRGGSDG